jgi:deoxycytidylate deaminase
MRSIAGCVVDVTTYLQLRDQNVITLFSCISGKKWMAELFSIHPKAQEEPETTSGLAKSIKERLSQELVFALVGPVGSGVSTAGRYLREQLRNRFEYDVPDIFVLSGIIRDTLVRSGKPIPSRDTMQLDEYVNAMQSAGNDIRSSILGDNYLVEKAIEQICRYRKSKNGYAEGRLWELKPARRAFVIDSLKHVSELKLLRDIYGETLCVIGVFAPDKVRLDRLINLGANKDDVQNVLDRDRDELATFGQKTEKVFIQADFFVCNDRKLEELHKNIDRFLDIIFSCSLHTPTMAEAAMYYADSTASNSACLSRQVGAAIVSKTGELIAVGRNDVPRAFGGLYREEDQSSWDRDKARQVDRDHRCFNWNNPAGKSVCHNDFRKNKIVGNAHTKLDKALAKIAAIPQLVKSKLPKGFSQELEQVNTLLNDVKASVAADVHKLTEFSRSIHAEMEAILAVAREGKHSLVGATLYTNTYPCHNCARHIVAAGIEKVFYIEPYKKSLALELHGDAITEDVDDHSRVIFRQFEGVAPKKYRKFFHPKAERKVEGCFRETDTRLAVPMLQMPLDGLVSYEDKIVADLEQKEQIHGLA